MTPARANAWPEPKLQTVAADILVRRHTARWIRKTAGGAGGGGGTPSTIVVTELTKGGDLAATSHVTASITVAAGDFLFMYAAAAHGTDTGAINPPTGAGQTWVRPSSFNSRLPDLTLPSPRRAATFCAVGVAGSGAITFTTGATDDAAWCIVKVTGVDLTNPFATGSMLNTAANGTSQFLYARKFTDAVYNASLVCVMSGNNADSNVAGTGYTMVSHAQPPGSLPSIGIEWKVGEDLIPSWTWPTSASNWGFVYELRAANSTAIRPIDYNLIAYGGTGTNATSYTITAPIWTGADVIYLAVVTMRSGANPVQGTVAGGGVTWVAVDAGQVFDDGIVTAQWRLSVFRAKGPLDGTNVVITCEASTTGNDYWMIALPGADTSGTNGSGSVVQVVKATALATANCAVTLAANADPRNGVILVGASQTFSTATRVVPSGGMMVAAPDQAPTLEPTHSGPNTRLWVGFLPFNLTALTCAMSAASNVAAYGIEVKAA